MPDSFGNYLPASEGTLQELLIALGGSVEGSMGDNFGNYLPASESTLQAVVAAVNSGGGGGSGFTYDQQTVPTAPIDTGDTWRERDASNLIKGQWFWDGVQWVSIQVFSEFLYNAFTSFSSPFVLYNSTQILILKFVIVAVSDNTGDNDVSNHYIHDLKRKNNTYLSESSIATVSTQALSNGRNLTASVDVNQVFSASNVDGFLCRFTTVGTPKEVGQGSSLMLFRLVK